MVYTKLHVHLYRERTEHINLVDYKYAQTKEPSPKRERVLYQSQEFTYEIPSSFN